MSKEHLEEIKKMLEDKAVIDRSDYEWLIEQAERVQELKEINERIQSKNIATNSKLFYTEQQNKRYRDLLEKVDYLLEKAGETDEDIYDLVRHVRTLIYLEEGEE